MTYLMHKQSSRVGSTDIFGQWAIRAMDIAVALVGLVVSLPVMVLIALAIKIDNPGPAIFGQTRIGMNRRRKKLSAPENGKEFFQDRRKKDLGGRPFTFYKFRTMFVDAKVRFPELYQYNYTPEEIETLCFKIPYDPRLTRLGWHLRKTTLDELPNFFNVLIGDMTLVGPRPDIPEMTQYYKDWQRRKFDLKPGITGLAQANGRALLNFQETLRLDVKWIDSCSFTLRTKIMLKTIWVTILKIGAF